MLTFGIEKLAGIWDEKVECSQNHWKETTMFQHGEILNPLLSRYQQYEDLGLYVEIVARDGEKLAGFCGMYLTPSMHTQTMLATEDILYIKPEYRNGKNGYRFYEFIEEEMKRLGAKKVMLTAPVGSVANKILLKLDCTHSANMYEKILT